MFEREIVGIDIGGLQAFSGIVPSTVLPDGQMAVLLCITRQIVVHIHSYIELLMRVGKRQLVGITGHGGTHMGFFVNHHETAGKIEIVDVVTIDNKQVITRKEGHHVVFRKLEVIVDIID